MQLTALNKNTVLLQLPESEKSDFAHDDFAAVTGGNGASAEEFYVAVKGEAVMGTVSDVEVDRAVVAALIANWISRGYKVSNVSRKDLIKKLRNAPTVQAKVEDALPASPEGGNAQEDGGDLKDASATATSSSTADAHDGDGKGAAGSEAPAETKPEPEIAKAPESAPAAKTGAVRF